MKKSLFTDVERSMSLMDFLSILMVPFWRLGDLFCYDWHYFPEDIKKWAFRTFFFLESKMNKRVWIDKQNECAMWIWFNMEKIPEHKRPHADFLRGVLLKHDATVDQVAEVLGWVKDGE